MLRKKRLSYIYCCNEQSHSKSKNVNHFFSALCVSYKGNLEALQVKFPCYMCSHRYALYLPVYADEGKKNVGFRLSTAGCPGQSGPC